MQACSADVINALPQANFVASVGARSNDLATKKAARAMDAHKNLDTREMISELIEAYVTPVKEALNLTRCDLHNMHLRTCNQLLEASGTQCTMMGLTAAQCLQIYLETGTQATCSVHTDQLLDLYYGEGSLIGRAVCAVAGPFMLMILDADKVMHSVLVQEGDIVYATGRSFVDNWHQVLPPYCPLPLRITTVSHHWL